MSVKQISKVWDWSIADGSALLVMLALADFCDDDGYCFPGISRIAKKCKISERSVQRIVSEMEDAGELSREISEGAKVTGDRGIGHTNRYHLHISPKRGDIHVTPFKRGVTGSGIGVSGSAERGDTAITPKPLGEPSGKPSEGREAKDKTPTSHEAIWVCELFGRKLTTVWKKPEIKAFKQVQAELDEETRGIVSAYYQAEREKGTGDKGGIHRRTLDVFLNNALGEIERARMWARQHPKMAAAIQHKLENPKAPGTSSKDILKSQEFHEWFSITYGKSPAEIPAQLADSFLREYKEQLR